MNLTDMIMVICNYNGRYEHNHLYTIEEMKERNFALLSKCQEKKDTGKWTRWESWEGETLAARFVENEKDFDNFIAGKYNDTEVMNEKSPRYNDCWYWGNSCTDMFELTEGYSSDRFDRNNNYYK